MALDPARDIAVRTTMFDDAAQLLLGERLLGGRPFDAAQYRAILAFSHAVLDAMKSWAWLPRDLIDVQTFLWVVTYREYPAAAAEGGGEENS